MYEEFSCFVCVTGSPFKFRVGPPEEGEADNLETEPPVSLESVPEPEDKEG